MKLYLVETTDQECYVVAYHPTQAYEVVRDLMERGNYGFETDRRLRSVSEIATADEGWPGVVDNFKRLIVATQPTEEE